MHTPFCDLDRSIPTAVAAQGGQQNVVASGVNVDGRLTGIERGCSIHVFASAPVTIVLTNGSGTSIVECDVGFQSVLVADSFQTCAVTSTGITKLSVEQPDSYKPNGVRR